MHNPVNDPTELLRQIAQLVRLPADADLHRDLLPTLVQALAMVKAAQYRPHAMVDLAHYKSRSG